MVRNPRTLMMCGLLALATGMALGSRIAPTATGLAPAATPAFAQRVAASGGPWATREAPAYTTAAPAPAPAETTVDTPLDAATAPGIEGGRQPRMPRMSRETMARPSR
jgi:hypothetical protein